MAATERSVERRNAAAREKKRQDKAVGCDPERRPADLGPSVPLASGSVGHIDRRSEAARAVIGLSARHCDMAGIRQLRILDLSQLQSRRSHRRQCVATDAHKGWFGTRHTVRMGWVSGRQCELVTRQKPQLRRLLGILNCDMSSSQWPTGECWQSDLINLLFWNTILFRDCFTILQLMSRPQSGRTFNPAVRRGACPLNPRWAGVRGSPTATSAEETLEIENNLPRDRDSR
jgi:hypothetical protein